MLSHNTAQPRSKFSLRRFWPRHKAPEIICRNPNCRYEGPALCKSQISIIIYVGLLLCGILPGIIYLIICQGYRYCCPKCGVRFWS